MARKEALYKKIENDLLGKINRGLYEVDDFIPTEMELAKQYNVSRVTVRQATNNLVKEGYLIRNQGSGTVVARSCPKIGKATEIKSFKEEILELGKTPSTDILKFEIIKGDKTICEILKKDVNALVYYVIRLRKADDEPMVLEISYISVDDFPDLTYNQLKESKYQYYEKEKKLIIDHSEQIITPILPDKKTAEYLQVSEDKPLIKVMNTTYLDTGKVLDYTEMILNSEKYQYTSIKTR